MEPRLSILLLFAIIPPQWDNRGKSGFSIVQNCPLSSIVIVSGFCWEQLILLYSTAYQRRRLHMWCWLNLYSQLTPFLFNCLLSAISQEQQYKYRVPSSEVDGRYPNMNVVWLYIRLVFRSATIYTTISDFQSQSYHLSGVKILCMYIVSKFSPFMNTHVFHNIEIDGTLTYENLHAFPTHIFEQ